MNAATVLPAFEYIGALVNRLPSLATTTRVIPWSCPVAVFGNSTTARVATVGINPSNREFVDEQGCELVGSARRFHTLQTLGISRWEEATGTHFHLINESWSRYFCGNPYTTWFDVLERLLTASGHTYYGCAPTACHLDLVPYATAAKWTSLSALERSRLLDAGKLQLAKLIARSSLAVLILNGRTVIDAFQSFAGLTFERRIVKAWALPRRDGGVAGVSYTAHVSALCGLRLRRSLMVVGHNHNLQSSFGVTNKVKDEIGRWVAKQIGGIKCRNAW